MPETLLHPVQVAHGDAWQADGRARIGSGGGVLAVRGARAAASGIPTPKWNNADLSSPEPDWEALRDWYSRLHVPWGVRVPLQFRVAVGAPLFHKRSFELRPGWLKGVPLTDGVTLREAIKVVNSRLA